MRHWARERILTLILCCAIIYYIMLHYVMHCIISYFNIEGNKLLSIFMA